MKKLIRGVVEFREKVRPSMLDRFGELASGQSPDVLLVSCSDSRVAVNVFASTDPGDVFVLRNIGNIIPPIDAAASSYSRAALDFALGALNVKHILVCGHSECGAMIAIHNGIQKVKSDGLREWLKYGVKNLSSAKDHNILSKENVLHQIARLKKFPEVAKRVAEGTLHLHGWWFDIKHADVYYFNDVHHQFELLNQSAAEKLLSSLPD